MGSNFTIGDAAVHLPFAVLAVSYFLTNMLWLRIAAIAGLLLAAVYVYFFATSMAVVIAWSAVIIAINLYQIVVLTRQQTEKPLPASDMKLLRAALPNLEDRQIHRLLKAAEWETFEPGSVLTSQDVPVDALYCLCSGAATAEVNSFPVASLGAGDLVGEVAYLTGGPATAKVIVSQPARVLRFTRARVEEMIAADPLIAGAFYQMLGRDLASKIRRTDARIIPKDSMLEA